MPMSVPVLGASRLAAVSPSNAARQTTPPPSIQFDLSPPAAMHKTEPSASGTPAEAFQDLEAMLVRSLMGAFIPKQSLGGADSGLAGEYWGSLFADELANALSSSMRFGIAESLGESMVDKMINRERGVAK